MTGMNEFDVVVLGSGCAGMTTALAAADSGASVLLVEKEDVLGGTTALSGGVAWLPANPLQGAAGVEDSREAALAYLSSLSHGFIRPEMAEAFVDTVDEVFEWAHTRTPVRLRLVEGYPDYHPEHPGGLPGGGRSVESELFSFLELGEWADRFFGRRRSTYVAESPIGGGTGFLSPQEHERRTEQQLEGLGRGLLGSLFKGLLDRGVEVRTGTGASTLVTVDGRVTGVELTDGTRVSARRGVVLATGGFERNADLVRAFLRGPLTVPPGAPGATGDGLRMAMRVGAQLDVMREAWWVPVVEFPGFEGETYSDRGVQLVQRERTLPRTIMVNGQGRRFTNEAANYNALGAAFHVFHPTRFEYENQPAWAIFDQGFVDEYGGYGVRAGRQMPEGILRAETVADLAGLIGVDAVELNATVARWNELCELGVDLDHGRGDSAYDGWCGDRREYPGRMATLGPIDSGPFYAARIHSSALGTKGGPRTTVDCEVLDLDGEVIRGLYAVGNVQAAPTGMVYGGAGGTLGPAFVFGYRCGRAVAGA